MINFAVGKYTEAYIGYVSDRLDDKSKYGRRKPFIIIGYMLMAISVVLFSIKPGNDKMVVRLWFICMRVIYTIGSTMLTVSFSAWMIESTNDTADYTKIYAIAIPIGNLVLGSMGLGLLSMSFFCAAVLFFLVGGISTLLLCTRVPNVVRRISTAEPSLIPSLREAWRMNEFRILFVNTTLVLSMATLIFLFAGYILLTGFGIATLDRLVHVANK